MKLVTKVYSQADDFDTWLNQQCWPDGGQLLIQLYSSISDTAALQSILNHLQHCFPEAVLVGASSAGAIHQGQLCQDRALLSFSWFESSQVSASLLSFEPIDWSSQLAEQSKLLLLLSSGSGVEHTNLLETLPENSSLVVCGGVAASVDGSRWISLGTEIYHSAALAVVLSGPSLAVKMVHKCNWQPLGDPLTVERSEGRHISQLGGRSVEEVYRHYLGASVSAGLPEASRLFPLTFERHGQLNIRVVTELTEQGALVADSIAEGEQLRLGFADPDTLLNNDYLQSLQNFATQGLWLYSCAGRKQLLGDKLEQELAPFNNLSAHAGFYTAGEFVTAPSGRADLLNSSLAAVALTESPSESSQPCGVFRAREFSFSSQQVYDSLCHFTKVVCKQLHDSKAQLQAQNAALARQAELDKLTGIYNRHALDRSLANSWEMSKRYLRPLSLIMFDIDNFKLINDRHGHQQGDRVLQAIAACVAVEVRQIDTFGRWGGEEFMIICPETELARANSLAQRLCQQIADSEFCHGEQVTASFGVVQCRSAETAEQLVGRVDQLLYQAKYKGRNQVITGDSSRQQTV